MQDKWNGQEGKEQSGGDLGLHLIVCPTAAGGDLVKPSVGGEQSRSVVTGAGWVGL